METDAPTPPDAGDADRPEAARADWRLLHHLRDRVEAAAREIERLREENASLAERVAEMQSSRDRAPSFSFGAEEDSEALKTRIQGFIDAIDGLLAEENEGRESDAA